MDSRLNSAFWGLRLGGYVVAAWLTVIALSLSTSGRFFDVAVRDLVMAVGAFTLAKLSEVRQGSGAEAKSRSTLLHSAS
jgi:hypothetical protein